jgi:tyrosine-protein kinase Etk/Wzc
MLRNFETEFDPLTGQPAHKEISLLDLLIVVTRERKRILAGTGVAAVLGLLIALILPTRYTATTSILPPQQSSASSGAALMAQLGNLGALAGGGGGGGGGAGVPGLKNPNDLQVALLRSRTVEDAVIERFHLGQLYGAKDETQARKLLEKWVDVDSGAKDGLIRISVTDRDRRRAAAIANGYVDEFKKFSATLAVTEASQRRLFFEEQLEQAKDKLADAEEDLKRTEQKTGLIQLDSQDRAAISSLAQLRALIAAKEVQIRGLRTFATTDNPNLHQAEAELSALRAEAETLGSPSTGDSGSVLMPKGVMQEASLQYVRKLREVKYDQELFDVVARQYEAAKVDEARQGAFVQVVDRAVPPDQRSSPKIIWIILGATILGAALSTLWAFAKEGLTRLVHNPEERSRIETLRALVARENLPSNR